MPGIDSYTKLMLHCNGADGSTTFTDSSASAHTVTAVDNSQIDTAIYKFGGASGLLDGTGDLLQVPTHTDWDLASQDFSLEMFVQFHAIDAAGGALTPLIHRGDKSTSGGWSFVYFSDSTQNKLMLMSGPNAIRTSYVWSPSLNTWYHVAATRSVNDWSLYVDGVQVSTANSATAIGASTSPLKIGWHPSYSTNWYTEDHYLNAHIDEVRVSVGIARGTTSYPVPTEEYTGPVRYYSRICA